MLDIAIVFIVFIFGDCIWEFTQETLQLLSLEGMKVF